MATTYLVSVDLGTRAAIFDTDGNPVAEAYEESKLTYPKPGWVEQQPDVFRRIARFVVPGGYVPGRMAGLKDEDVFTDRTYLHFSCLSDTQAGQWSDELPV